MRIDKYLKVTRLIKRRTIAKEVLDNGFISINGNKAKPSSEIQIGDEVVMKLGARTIKFIVLEIKEFANAEIAQKMYKIIDEK